MQAPLVPAGCDLRDFPYLPLDVVRLRDSSLAITASDGEFRAAVLLWCASWHQMPAASLPDDDAQLAQFAGYGRVVEEWRKVKAGALRGWVKCSDGRLYHPVVAQKAREAWRSKAEQRWKTECARIKKYNQRHGTSMPCPSFDEFLSPELFASVPGDKIRLSPETDEGCPETVPRDKLALSPGTSGDCPELVPHDISGINRGCPNAVPRETHSKRSKGKRRESKPFRS